MRALRRVAGVSRPDCIRNGEIMHRLQQRSIVDVCSKREEGELEVERDGEAMQEGNDRGDGRTLAKSSLAKAYPTPSYEYSIADVVGELHCKSP